MSHLTITYTKKKRRRCPSPVDSQEGQGNECGFCRSAEDCEEDYGKVIRKCGFTVHYFCMLFSSGLCQRGKTESKGIFGFLPADIRRELGRGNRLRCTYCKEKGATIGCVVSSCRRAFHLTCGRKNGSLHQFFDSFRSYCPEHRPRQTVQISDRLAFVGTANTVCSICMYAVVARTSNDTLRVPCCKNSWFHRGCIQRYALSSGLYFFKCPLCNSKDLFQSEMLQYGIYIPDQDAAWEREPNAFRDLYERYAHCDAVECRCPNGRDFDQDKTKWEILVCEFCGSQGSHSACNGLRRLRKHQVCAECEDIDKHAKQKGRSKKSPGKVRNRTQAELRQMLQDRVAKLVTEQSDTHKSKSNTKLQSQFSPSLSRESTPSSRRSLRCQGLPCEPDVLHMQHADTDTEVDVEAADSEPDEDSSCVGLRKRRRVSLSVSQTQNKSQTSTRSNIQVKTGGESASIHATSNLGKYSNYVTVSTVHDSDVRQWGMSDKTTHTTGLKSSSLVNFTSDDEADSLTIASSDDSDSEICAVDEVHEDSSKKTVTIKWKGKKIRIYKEVEKDDSEDISKWSLHLEVGDTSDRHTLVSRTPKSMPSQLDMEESPPQLVPIDEEITIKCTPPTRPYMLNLKSQDTANSQHSLDSEPGPPKLSPIWDGVQSRITRNRSLDVNGARLDSESIMDMIGVEPVSDRGARYSRRSLEKTFSNPQYDQIFLPSRSKWDDTDSIASATNSVITLSSNAAENECDDSESDCLIVEPVYITSNERTEEGGRVSYSAQIAVGSPFREQVYPSASPYRYTSGGNTGYVIDLTGSPTTLNHAHANI